MVINDIKKVLRRRNKGLNSKFICRNDGGLFIEILNMEKLEQKAYTPPKVNEACIKTPDDEERR